jgi:PPM family protein phosphatase
MLDVDLHHGASTDVGLVRKVNEDSYLVAPPVFVVADGMGGHSGGDVASQMVVEEFQRLAESYDPRRGAELVADAFTRAQARIVDYGDAHRAMQPGWHAGTTAVVAVLVVDDGVTKWLLANLGDSRIYALNGDGLVRVSVDHSLVQELVDAGRITEEEAAIHPERHIVTRALGGPDDVEPDYFLLSLADARRILLCSDGVTGMVDDGEIAKLLTASADPRDVADRLVAAALSAGGIDNATAVVVDAVEPGGRS